MKNILLIFLLAFLFSGIKAEAQESTKSIQISGAISEQIQFDLADLKKIDSQPIPDLIISNHAGEPRGTAKDLKGFPVKKLLEKVVFQSPSPKQLSEFYLVFKALDGYTVVFSWNELFNNPVGEEVFIITSMGSESMENMEDGILLVSHSDIRTGRRHVKNLSHIIIQRVE